MDGLDILYVCYGMVAACACYMSWREARSQGFAATRLPGYVAGAALCLLWPLAIVVMVGAILRENRADDAAPAATPAPAARLG